MSTTVLGRARWIFGVMAAMAFSALMLGGCGLLNLEEEEKEYDANLILGDGYVWGYTDEDGMDKGYIFKANGDMVLSLHRLNIARYYANITHLLGFFANRV